MVSQCGTPTHLRLLCMMLVLIILNKVMFFPCEMPQHFPQTITVEPITVAWSFGDDDRLESVKNFHKHTLYQVRRTWTAFSWPCANWTELALNGQLCLFVSGNAMHTGVASISNLQHGYSPSLCWTAGLTYNDSDLLSTTQRQSEWDGCNRSMQTASGLCLSLWYCEVGDHDDGGGAYTVSNDSGPTTDSTHSWIIILRWKSSIAAPVLFILYVGLQRWGPLCKTLQGYAIILGSQPTPHWCELENDWEIERGERERKKRLRHRLMRIP